MRCCRRRFAPSRRCPVTGAARCAYKSKHRTPLLSRSCIGSSDGGTQVMYVLAKLSIGDRLAAGPKTADQLAEESGATWFAWRPLSYSEQLSSLHKLCWTGFSTHCFCSE